ncbi:MAG: VOC family protein, partial [Pyrinomonadaceae bacterium]
SRHYIDCGPVILALVDGSAEGKQAKPLPDYIYFAVADLQSVHDRARALNCLSNGDVHGDPAGEIIKRSWGELSFYVADPWGNGLCFVDEQTLFTGK